MPKSKSPTKPVKRRAPKGVPHLPMEVWGKDHWSLLAFIECLCVDQKGVLDDKRRMNMRCNPARHPMHGYFPRGDVPWKPDYGSRLKHYFQDKAHQMPEHDDFDCAEDFEHAGLLENNGTGINPVWKLTPKGLEITAKLRAHKANGGNFSSFTP